MPGHLYRYAVCSGARVRTSESHSPCASLDTLAPSAPCFIGHRLKKQLLTVFSSLTGSGAPEKTLAKASDFFNEAHLRCMKNAQGVALWSVSSAHGEVSVRFASCERKLHSKSRAHHGNAVAASYLRSKCFIKSSLHANKLTILRLCAILMTRKAVAKWRFY